MDPEQFWVRLWTIAAASILAFTALMTVHSLLIDMIYADLVKSGKATPLEARCMHVGSVDSSCALIFAKETK